MAQALLGGRGGGGGPPPGWGGTGAGDSLEQKRP
jgi:hypothetical protein